MVSVGRVCRAGLVLVVVLGVLCASAAVPALAAGGASGRGLVRTVTLHTKSGAVRSTGEVRVRASTCRATKAARGVTVMTGRVSLALRLRVSLAPGPGGDRVTKLRLVQRDRGGLVVTAPQRAAGCRLTVALPRLYGSAGPVPVSFAPRVRLALSAAGAWTAQLARNQAFAVDVDPGRAAGGVASLAAGSDAGVSAPAAAGSARAAGNGRGRASLHVLGLVRLGSKTAALSAYLNPEVSVTSARDCRVGTSVQTGAVNPSAPPGAAASVPVPSRPCQAGHTLISKGATEARTGMVRQARGKGPVVPPASTSFGYAAAAPVTATYGSGAYATLAQHLDIRSTRLLVPFDTLATARRGRCVSTRHTALYSGSQTWSEALRGWLGAVTAAGERPLLSIGRGAAGTDDAGARLAELGNSPTDAAYRCGLRALMETTQRWSARAGTAAVHEWEVFNEPDVDGTCATLAASYYVRASRLDKALGRSDTLIAGAFKDFDDPFLNKHYDCGHRSGDWYIADYVHALERDGVWPRVFSWHPFADAGYSGAERNGDQSVQTSDVLRYLNSQPEPAPAVWLTESAVWLENGVHDSAGRTLGFDLDGRAVRQAWGAVGFLNLAHAAGQAYAGQVARVYWYEFQPDGDGSSQGSARFDSGLVGISSADWSEGGVYDPAAKQYAVPRASYCVLAYGDTPAAAVKDRRCDFTRAPHNPASDWESPDSHWR